jgi:peptide/nickel transport system permease protein
MSMSEVSSIETKTAVAELRTGRWGALRQLAKLRESPIGMLGLALVVGWIIIALLAPLLAPFPPNQSLRPMAQPGAAAPAGGVFWLGTDHLGRYSPRADWGARTVLTYAPIATPSASPSPHHGPVAG